MTNDTALMAKLESAEGGTAELDEAIYDAIGRPGDDDRRYYASIYGDCPPHYTRSIDAAMTLIEEGHFLERLGQCPAGWNATISDKVDDTKSWEGVEAATPALALCIAALRARLASA